MNHRISVAILLILTVTTAWAQDRAPVIDVHLHIGPGVEGSRYYTPREGETLDEAKLRTLREDMDAHNVVLGIAGGPPASVKRYREAMPGRLIGGVMFPCTDGKDNNLIPCFDDGGDWPDIEDLERWVQEGRIGALGELLNVYAGISPTDPRMMPYYALAEDHDLIVLAHADSGPPPRARVEGCCPNFDGRFGDPALFEPVLERHPDLRIILYHVFRPEFVESTIELLHTYPNVMVDVSPMAAPMPEPWVPQALERLVDAGHGDRILFGSDYLGTIGESLAMLESTALSEEQKRAILYDNAARFLRLDEDQIARHHRMVGGDAAQRDARGSP